MTCRECEIALAMEETSEDVKRHLETCAACRALAGEIQANTEAFRSMGEETLMVGGVRGRVMARIGARQRMGWASLVAAAALLLVTIGAAREWRKLMAPVPPPQVRVAAADPVIELPPVEPRPRPVRVKRAAERPTPLVVKMLTDDPDVVIYWLVNGDGERKAGEE